MNHGRDAFHRVRFFASAVADAVERVPTIPRVGVEVTRLTVTLELIRVSLRRLLLNDWFSKNCFSPQPVAGLG